MTSLNEWKMDFGRDLYVANKYHVKKLEWKYTRNENRSNQHEKRTFSIKKKTVCKLESRQSDKYDDIAKELKIQTKEIKNLYQLKKVLDEVKVQTDTWEQNISMQVNKGTG